MLRTTAFCSIAALVTMITGAAAQGYTTRIEPRPFYGAVVTLEEGVFWTPIFELTTSRVAHVVNLQTQINIIMGFKYY